MSRRTERPYKVDGTGELAPHSAAPCSVPEINGPVVQQEFTSLLRETCNPSLSATTGLAASNGGQAGPGVSRGHSTESHEPGNTPESLTTWEGLNLAGRHDHRWSCSGSDEADWPSYRQRPSWQRKSAAQSARTARNRRTRTRMSGGVGAGRSILPATRLGGVISTSLRSVVQNH